MTAHRSSAPCGAALVFAALVFAALAFAACTHAATHTGVEISATYAVAIDQLLMSGTMDGASAFAPGVLPDEPRPLQPEGESATLYLPVALVGKSIVLRVDGLRAGQVVATGGVAMTVLGAHIQKVAVVLEAPVVCGDGVINPLLEACDDGNRQAGDGCGTECEVESGYSCASAPSQCLPRCGGAPACATGQHCLSDTCVCDATSCPSGCCAGNVCVPGNAANACGSAGQACGTCPAEQTCTAGACSGCSQSCNGCCAGSTCTSEVNAVACGPAGARCLACDAAVADSCVNGACACGVGPPCKGGEGCKNGKCSCDVSCTGCCDAGGCEARATQTCGADGASCTACNLTVSNGCAADGSCACGSAPACAAGETCSTSGVCQCNGAVCSAGLHCSNNTDSSKNACVCDTTSCSGCCVAAFLTNPASCKSFAQESATQCGANGTACAMCAHGDKHCTQGACSK